MKTPEPKHISRAEAQLIFNTIDRNSVAVTQIPTNNCTIVVISEANWEDHPTENYKHLVVGKKLHHFKVIGKNFTP
jgi:hypothetical protein